MSNKTIEIPNMILQIEITDLCNLKCIWCVQSFDKWVYGTGSDTSPHQRHNMPEFRKGTKGFVDFSTYTTMIDDIYTSGIIFDSISLMWIGESLLHPKFFEILDYMLIKNKHQKFVNTITLNTAGNRLTKEISDLIIKYFTDKNNTTGLNLVFSLDVASKESHKKYKGVNLFDKTIKNIKYFLNQIAICRENDVDVHITTMIQSLVFPEIYDDVENFMTYWVKFCRKINLDIQVVESEGGWDNNVDCTVFFKKGTGSNQIRLDELHSTIRDKLNLPKVYRRD